MPPISGEGQLASQFAAQEALERKAGIFSANAGPVAEGTMAYKTKALDKEAAGARMAGSPAVVVTSGPIKGGSTAVGATIGAEATRRMNPPLASSWWEAISASEGVSRSVTSIRQETRMMLNIKWSRKITSHRD